DQGARSNPAATGGATRNEARHPSDSQTENGHVMAETQVVERTPTNTLIRTGGNGQTLSIPSLIPILPIRNIVVFPGTVMPLNVGRPKSKSLLDEVMPGEKLVGVITQKNPETEDPQYPDLHTVGVASMILKLFKLPDGNQSII